MQISGSKVLLTGASGGLGQAIARELARRGATLTLTARNTTQLESLASEIGAEVIVADLTKSGDLAGLLEAGSSADILICNAGTGGDYTLPEETAEHIDQMVAVNLGAPMQMATAFAQHKLATGSPGHIVFVGSLSGLAASPNTRLYNATKFGLRGFALSLRQDLEGSSVGASIVEPGFIRDAGMFAASDLDVPGFVRTKSPEDVAAGVISAVERDRGEVFVAPVELRLSATLASVAPGLSARIQRMAGASDITAKNSHPT